MRGKAVWQSISETADSLDKSMRSPVGRNYVCRKCPLDTDSYRLQRMTSISKLERHPGYFALQISATGDIPQMFYSTH